MILPSVSSEIAYLHGRIDTLTRGLADAEKELDDARRWFAAAIRSNGGVLRIPEYALTAVDRAERVLLTRSRDLDHAGGVVYRIASGHDEEPSTADLDARANQAGGDDDPVARQQLRDAGRPGLWVVTSSRERNGQGGRR